MPGFILHLGATVLCAHGGQAQPTVPDSRVLVSGQPIVTLSAPHAIVGCPFVAGSVASPCVTAQWTVGATRVTATGVPVLVQSSQAVCAPNGAPVTITVTQTRVSAL